MKEKLKRILTFKTFGSKLILVCLINYVLILIAMLTIFDEALFKLETELTMSKLNADIVHLNDSLCGDNKNPWSCVHGFLYCNGISLGDGTPCNANRLPFKTFEAKTGSLCYVFKRTYDDDTLGWVGDEKTGYQQGHYMRVSGTTRGPKGENIIGTHIERSVADALEEDGTYVGVANVSGNPIYCIYETFCDTSGEIIGCISVGVSELSMKQHVGMVRTRILHAMVAIMFFAALFFVSIAGSWSKAITAISNYLVRIGKGELPQEKLRVRTRDELSDVADCVNGVVDSLREKQRMDSELNVATNIQLNLLPHGSPAFPGHDEFDVYGFMHPAREVGGDLYDYFMIDDHRVVFVIADVSGKGVPAALFSVKAKTIIKDLAQLGMAPGDVFTTVNNALCEGNTEGLFVTAWMACVDLKARKLTYVNAGHNPPLIRRKDGQFEYLRDSRPSLVLGGMEGIRYRTKELDFEPGDRLFLYTDGVPESTDVNGKLFGEARLQSALNEVVNGSFAEVTAILKARIDEFVGAAEQFDDITILIFDYKKSVDTMEKEFDAVVENLGPVTDYVSEELERLGASPKVLIQVTVALEEIFVNVASYAYPDRKGIVTVGVTERDGYGVISFKDSGIPFNPLEKPDPDITLNAEERGIGGLGIYMVKKSMDSVHYEYKDNQNVFIMEKKLK